MDIIWPVLIFIAFALLFYTFRILREYEQKLYQRNNGDQASRPVAVESSEPASNQVATKSLEQVRQQHLTDSFWSVEWSRTGTRS